MEGHQVASCEWSIASFQAEDSRVFSGFQCDLIRLLNLSTIAFGEERRSNACSSGLSKRRKKGIKDPFV